MDFIDRYWAVEENIFQWLEDVRFVKGSVMYTYNTIVTTREAKTIEMKVKVIVNIYLCVKNINFVALPFYCESSICSNFISLCKLSEIW